MHASASQLVLVLLLIGWKSGANLLSQSRSVVIANQLLFDTHMKTALCHCMTVHIILNLSIEMKATGLTLIGKHFKEALVSRERWWGFSTAHKFGQIERLSIVSLQKRPWNVSWITKCKSRKIRLESTNVLKHHMIFQNLLRMDFGLDKVKTILEAPDFPALTRSDSVSLIESLRRRNLLACS